MKISHFVLTVGLCIAGGGIEAAPASLDEVILITPKDAVSTQRVSSLAGAELIHSSARQEVRSLPAASLPKEPMEGVMVMRPASEKLNLARGLVSTASDAEVRQLRSQARKLQLVQFKTPLEHSQRRVLVGSGCQIIAPVPSMGWLVWAPNPSQFEATLSRSALEPLLQYVGDFRTEYALSPVLDSELSKGGLVAVNITLYGGVEESDLDLEWIHAQSDFQIDSTDSTNPSRVAVSALVPGTRLEELAALETVLSVERVGELGFAGESQGLILAGETKLVSGFEVPKTPAQDGASYLTWLTGKMAVLSGFDATLPNNYPIAVVVDTGLDSGGSNSDSSFLQPNSRDLRLGGSVLGASRIGFAFRWDNVANNVAYNDDGVFTPTPYGPEWNTHGHSVASVLGGYNNSTGAENEHAPTLLQFGLGINPWGRLASAKLDLRFNPFQHQDFDSLIQRYHEETHFANIAAALAAPTVYVDFFSMSNNSWFTITSPIGLCGDPNYDPTPYRYDGYCRTADNRSRDARPGSAVPGNQQVLMVFAAGNSGRQVPVMAGAPAPSCGAGSPFANCRPSSCGMLPLENSIFTPNLAKCVLTVGGTEDWDPRCPPRYAQAGHPCDACCVNGKLAFSWEGRSEGDDSASDGWLDSSKGVTPGRTPLGAPLGRIKPDLVAPARHVYANAYNSEVPDNELCDTLSANGQDDVNRLVAGTNAAAYQAYERCSGTSFAAPAVSAAASLAVPFLRLQHGVTDPTPALLKAHLINSTTFITGRNAFPEIGGQLPNAWQGFGRLNLAEVLRVQPRFIINETVVLHMDDDTRIGWSKTISNPGQPTRITMAYQDPPLATNGLPYGLLLNNLDLCIRLSYTTASGPYSAYFLGNAFDATQRYVSRVLYPSATIQTDPPYFKLWGDGDRYNNVESIVIPPLPAGATGVSLRIEVVLKQHTANGISFEEPLSDQSSSGQNFALVASNVQ